MIKRIPIIMLVFLLGSCAVSKYMKKGFVTNQEYVREIPFKYENEFILVPVTIDGKEYTFLFDTGAELNLIDPEIIDGLTSKKLKNGSVSNAQDIEKGVQMVEIASIGIGGIEFQETVGMVWDISTFSKYISCESVDGFIGNNLMRKSNWQIDYANQVIRISDNPEKFNHSDHSHAIKMDAREIGNVYLNLNIGGKDKAFIFDSGYNGFAQTGDTSLLTDTPSITKVGLKGANFTGVKKGATHYKMLDSFLIEGLSFKAPTYFLIKPENSSVLGNQFYEQYTLTIDWDNDQLVLDENPEFEAIESTILEVGFLTDYEKGITTIANIYEKSSLIGELKLQSTVVKIDTFNLIEIEESGRLCEFWTEEWESISEKDSITIVVENNGEHQEVVIQKIKG